MKRSEINAIVMQAGAFFREKGFLLPPWAFWAPSDWKGKRETCGEIAANMLGWDITDFGSGRFEECGLVLFTLRNGNLAKDKKRYAEKIMIVRENQETPFHFHWQKMEDIINRGGGNLVLELYGSTPSEAFSNRAIRIRVDGVVRDVPAGGAVILHPGESICLPPRLYHRFYGELGKGPVMVGEVSQVNNDSADNRFRPQVGRFPAIQEDEAPVRLLASDYGAYL